eukprot:jgi/Chlat1/6697/Chrsp49S06140
MDGYVQPNQGAQGPPLNEHYDYVSQGQYDTQGSGCHQQHQQQHPHQTFANQAEHFDSHGSGYQHPPHQQQHSQQEQLIKEKRRQREAGKKAKRGKGNDAEPMRARDPEWSVEETMCMIDAWNVMDAKTLEGGIYQQTKSQPQKWTEVYAMWKAVKAQFMEVRDFITSSGNKDYFRMTAEEKKLANMKSQLLLNSSALYDALWNGRKNSHAADPTQHAWDSSSPEPDADSDRTSAPENSSGRQRKGSVANDAVVAAFNQNTIMLIDLERERMRAQQIMFKEEMEFTRELAKDANASIERSIGALAAVMRPPI